MAFLVTTADQRFWKKDEKIVFLGEWCKRFEDRDVWSKLDYETLPYHWEDRERLYQDVDYLEAVYEKYLTVMTEQLNKIHQVNYSKRYWRTIVGIWLRLLIDSCYDRYLSVKAAIDSGKITKTWLCDMSPTLPKKPPSFAWDEYNQYLYSRIIKHLDAFPYEVKAFKKEAQSHSSQSVTTPPPLFLAYFLRLGVN